LHFTSTYACAHGFGITTIPQSLLLRADEVIQ
jgi:hypothetical protein